jgi:hypothetical protein
VIRRGPRAAPAREPDTQRVMSAQGTLLAAQYSFAPNRLDLCGPRETPALLDYLAEQASDRGLEHILRQFAGAYPYLTFIAASNGVDDPFDRRVVEAYWVGNPFLDRVRMTDFLQHVDDRFQHRVPRKLFEAVLGQIPEGARAHHNFHVFAMPIRTGRLDMAHTLRTMDECRISWGRITAVLEDDLSVARRPLVLRNDALALGEPESRLVRWRFDGKAFLHPRPGDVVSIHWGCACDRLTAVQLHHLRRETLVHLALANRRHRAETLA